MITSLSFNIGWVIPELQLKTWSNQASTARSAETYASVQQALKQLTDPPGYETFLQGSYRNATNIRADSDVDVVASMTTTFRRNIDRLTDVEKQRYHGFYSPGAHSYDDWRRNVLRALRSYYGTGRVHDGRKAIRIDGSGGRLDADVLPAMAYRHFTSFESGPGKYIEGIVFEDHVDGRSIVNWPKQHINNGATKNAATSDRYKPYVRMFKNARNAAADRGVINRDRVPSYFLEGLLYNASNTSYRPGFQQGYADIIVELGKAEFGNLWCQNEIVRLFGPTPEQWNEEDAWHALGGLADLWRGW